MWECSALSSSQLLEQQDQSGDADEEIDHRPHEVGVELAGDLAADDGTQQDTDRADRRVGQDRRTQQAVAEAAHNAGKAGDGEQELHTAQIAGVILRGAYEVHRHRRPADGEEPRADAAQRAADDAHSGLGCNAYPPCHHQKIEGQQHQEPREYQHQHPQVKAAHEGQDKKVGKAERDGRRQRHAPLDVPAVLPAQRHAEQLVDDNGQRRRIDHIEVKRQDHHEKDHRAEAGHRLDDAGHQTGGCDYEPDHMSSPLLLHMRLSYHIFHQIERCSGKKIPKTLNTILAEKHNIMRVYKE